jgi:hypothetical protein
MRRPTRMALGVPIRVSPKSRGDGIEASRKTVPITGGISGIELARARLLLGPSGLLC